MICRKNHRYARLFAALPSAQSEPGRHKCAGCAYEQGFEDGLNNQASRYVAIVEHLPYSQAGTVRHTSPEEAYRLGYRHGQERYQNDQPRA